MSSIENKIPYSAIKAGLFFYMSIDVSKQFSYIVPYYHDDNKVSFFSFQGNFGCFSNSLMSSDSPFYKIADDGKISFLFQKIGGPIVLEPKTKTFYTLTSVDGGFQEDKEESILTSSREIKDAADDMAFFWSYPVGIKCSKCQNFYLAFSDLGLVTNNYNSLCNGFIENQEALLFLNKKAKDRVNFYYDNSNSLNGMNIEKGKIFVKNYYRGSK